MRKRNQSPWQHSQAFTSQKPKLQRQIYARSWRGRFGSQTRFRGVVQSCIRNTIQETVNFEIPTWWVSSRNIIGEAVIVPCLFIDAWCNVGSWFIFRLFVFPLPVDLTSSWKTEWIKSNCCGLYGCETSAVLCSNFSIWGHALSTNHNTARALLSVAYLSCSRNWSNSG